MSITLKDRFTKCKLHAGWRGFGNAERSLPVEIFQWVFEGAQVGMLVLCVLKPLQPWRLDLLASWPIYDLLMGLIFEMLLVEDFSFAAETW